MLDIGTSSIRAGYAGDDTPKAIIPTSYGYTEEISDEQDVNMDMDGDKDDGGGGEGGKEVRSDEY